VGVARGWRVIAVGSVLDRALKGRKSFIGLDHRLFG